MRYAAAFLFVVILVVAPPATAKEADGARVVVLAFEGLDARVTERLMGEGRLPELARLAAGGGYARLMSPPPSVTPASWATFATGRDPGETGVVDIVTRDPETYRLSSAPFETSERPFLWGDRTPYVLMGAGAVLVWLALFFPLRLVARRSSWVVAVIGGVGAGVAGYLIGAGWIPQRVTEVEDRMKQTAFWTLAGEADITTEVARMPGTYPPRAARNVKILAGFGVPDLSGGRGRGVVYTSKHFDGCEEAPESPSSLIHLPQNDGKISTVIEGPSDPCGGAGEPLVAPVTFLVSDDHSMVEISTCGNSVLLRNGEWSPWIEVRFRSNPLLSIDGAVRFRAVSLSPHLIVLRTPVHPDPDRLPPGWVLSSPTRWARELWRSVGPFATAGWLQLGHTASEGAMEAQAVEEMISHRVDGERRILQRALQGHARLLVHHFEFPDRLEHLNAGEVATGGDGSATRAALEAYRTADAIVGETREVLEPGDVLLVLSDHGCTAPWRSVDINTWLVENGYLTLLREHGPQRARLPEDVDWSATRAYSVGFGGVYVNLVGRERNGTVEAGPEYEDLCDELGRGLTSMVDPDGSSRPVQRVIPTAQLYRWVDHRTTPDLLVTTSEGYGVTWSSAMGSIGQATVREAPSFWSCTHGSVDPEAIPGVIFATRPLDQQRVDMADVAPTILRLLDVTPPVGWGGRPFVRTDR